MMQTNIKTLDENSLENYLDSVFGGGAEDLAKILRFRGEKIKVIGTEEELDKLEGVRVVYKTVMWQVSIKTGDEIKTVLSTSEVMQGEKTAYIFDNENEEVIEVPATAREINDMLANLIDTKNLETEGKVDKKYVEIVYLISKDNTLYKTYLKLSQSAGGEYIGKGTEKKFRYLLDNPMPETFRAREKEYKGKISMYLFDIVPASYRLGQIIVDYPKFTNPKEETIPYGDLLNMIKDIMLYIKTKEKNTLEKYKKMDEEEEF